MEQTPQRVIQIPLTKMLVGLLTIIMYAPPIVILFQLLDQGIGRAEPIVIILVLLFLILPGALLSWAVKSYKNDKKIGLIFSTVLIVLYVVIVGWFSMEAYSNSGWSKNYNPGYDPVYGTPSVEF